MSSFDEFTDWLQQELERRGWDQAELSRRSGVTTAQVSRIFSGERSPGPTFCRKIARALHLPPEEVYRRAGLLPPERQKPEGADELLHLFAELGEEDRKRLLAITRALHGVATAP